MKNENNAKSAGKARGKSLLLRQQKIVELVQSRGFASIESLSEKFSVTPQTIRRDINELTEEGLLRRYHGGAGLSSSVENVAYTARKVMCRHEKIRIASMVAQHIPNNASLFIDIGTTSEEVARALLDHSGLRVITNNLNVASILCQRDDFEIIVTGGVVRCKDSGVIGESAIDFIEQFKADFGILSISGIDVEGTLLDFDYKEIRVDRAIIAHSKKVFLVADHTKFGRDAMVRLCNVSDIQALFTDRRPPADFERMLAQSQCGPVCGGGGDKLTMIDTSSFRHLYPFESHYLLVNGRKYHYLDEGRGEPVVMLHGNPTWSFYYRNLVRGLSDSYRTIVPDHIGCGLSEKPSPSHYGYRLENRVDDLERFLDQTGTPGWNYPGSPRLGRDDRDGLCREASPANRAHRGDEYVRLPETARQEAAFSAENHTQSRFFCRPRRSWNEFVRQGRPDHGSGEETGKGREKRAHRPLQLLEKQGGHAEICPGHSPCQDRTPAMRWRKKRKKNSRSSPMSPCLSYGESETLFLTDRTLSLWRRQFPEAEVHFFEEAGHYILEDEWRNILPIMRKFLRDHV